MDSPEKVKDCTEVLTKNYMEIRKKTKKIQ